ncbi:S-methyl-5'-thioadenosine phosphorylase-like, partial [Mizuhopecten yessoensis]|uniref:S-methyl-5'-thioadenosine phosphorylase-like n=1 Tax=Mizuhopecten yessoensis TaxID=6573 RepID=UPI000B45D75E
LLYNCAKELSIGCHKGGTMLTIEGPRFSSKAESKLFHSWGAHCINMTTVPEVVLAKEAGLCYASMALVTDYDSWRDNTESVNVQNVMKTFKLNASNALKVLMKAIPLIGQQDWSETIKANQDMVKSNTMLPHSY